MGAIDVAKRRRQMGQSLANWSSVDGAVHAVSQHSWMYLSGLPDHNVNFALLHGRDERDLDAVVNRIDEIAAPTLLFCAGDGLSYTSRLDPSWSHVTTMPFMITEVPETSQAVDERVRRATVADRDAVLALWTAAFEAPPETEGPVLDATLSDTDGEMSVFLLEHDGTAVSTVTTSRVGDAVAVWCMATAEQYGRRGFGRAVLAGALSRATGPGVEVALLAATAAGKRLYDSAGWSTLEEWEVYTNHDPEQAQ